jgi:profilin
MSWQAYVDQNLVGTKKVVQAAIHGHDGNVWATSAGLKVRSNEIWNNIQIYLSNHLNLSI